MTLDEGYDLALVAVTWDGLHKTTRVELIRIIMGAWQDAIDRADRAEAEVAKMKTELAAKEVANG